MGSREDRIQEAARTIVERNAASAAHIVRMNFEEHFTRRSLEAILARSVEIIEGWALGELTDYMQEAEEARVVILATAPDTDERYLKLITVYSLIMLDFFFALSNPSVRWHLGTFGEIMARARARYEHLGLSIDDMVAKWMTHRTLSDRLVWIGSLQDADPNEIIEELKKYDLYEGQHPRDIVARGYQLEGDLVRHLEANLGA